MLALCFTHSSSPFVCGDAGLLLVFPIWESFFDVDAAAGVTFIPLLDSHSLLLF